MALAVKKIYIDTRFKTKNSNSNSDFKFQLSQTVQLPDNCVCFFDDIIVPHSWWSIENYNNRLYIRQLDIGGSADDRIITIPSQKHTGASLELAIKAGLEAAFGAGTYHAVYNERKGTITITTSQATTTFMIVTDDWLQDVGDWSGAAIYTSNCKVNKRSIKEHSKYRCGDL